MVIHIMRIVVYGLNKQQNMWCSLLVSVKKVFSLLVLGTSYQVIASSLVGFANHKNL